MKRALKCIWRTNNCIKSRFSVISGSKTNIVTPYLYMCIKIILFMCVSVSAVLSWTWRASLPVVVLLQLWWTVTVGLLPPPPRAHLTPAAGISATCCSTPARTWPSTSADCTWTDSAAGSVCVCMLYVLQNMYQKYIFSGFLFEANAFDGQSIILTLLTVCTPVSCRFSCVFGKAVRCITHHPPVKVGSRDTCCHTAETNLSRSASSLHRHMQIFVLI